MTYNVKISPMGSILPSFNTENLHICPEVLENKKFHLLLASQSLGKLEVEITSDLNFEILTEMCYKFKTFEMQKVDSMVGNKNFAKFLSTRLPEKAAKIRKFLRTGVDPWEVLTNG